MYRGSRKGRRATLGTWKFRPWTAIPRNTPISISHIRAAIPLGKCSVHKVSSYHWRYSSFFAKFTDWWKQQRRSFCWPWPRSAGSEDDSGEKLARMSLASSDQGRPCSLTVSKEKRQQREKNPAHTYFSPSRRSQDLSYRIHRRMTRTHMRLWSWDVSQYYHPLFFFLWTVQFMTNKNARGGPTHRLLHTDVLLMTGSVDIPTWVQIRGYVQILLAISPVLLAHNIYHRFLITTGEFKVTP